MMTATTVYALAMSARWRCLLTYIPMVVVFSRGEDSRGRNGFADSGR